MKAFVLLAKNFPNALLLAALFFSGCHKNAVSRSQNEQEKIVQVVHDEAKSASQKDLEALDIKKLYDDSIHLKDRKSLAQLVSQLSNFILNKNYVEDPAYRHGDIMRALLSDFNQAFLSLYLLDPSSTDTGMILDRYIALAFSGCDSGSLKDCKNMDFFRQDFRSIDVLVLKVRILDLRLSGVDRDSSQKDLFNRDVVQYYRILGLISDEKNQEKLSEIEFLYLKHARDYANFLAPGGTTDEIPLSTRERLAQHASYFESLISKFDGDVKSKDFKEFVLNFKPWTYSRLERDIFPYGTERMFNYAAQSYLYIDKGNGTQTLNPDLELAIENSQASGKDDVTGKNFSDLVRELNTSNPKLLAIFGVDYSLIKSPEFMNEYFFIVDRLYRGHINSDEAKEIWNGSKKDKMKMLSTIEYYSKVQVLTLVNKTNQLMKLINLQKTDPNNILIKVVSDSAQITFLWNNMLNQIDVLNIFISNLFQTSEKDAAYLHTSVLLQSVKSNIKYISVYPNMLVLSYFISSLNVDINKPNHPGETISPEEVIVELFDARLQPWFHFGNDDAFGISKLGVIFSYHFSIITANLDEYSPKVMDKNPLAFTQKNLFEKVNTKYLINEKQAIETAIDSLQTTFSSNSTFGVAMQVCNSLSLDKATAKVVSNTSINRNIEDLDKYVSVGNSVYGPTSSFESFYAPNAGTSRIADVVRSSFDRKLVRVEGMLQILSQDKDFISATDAEKTEMIEAIKKQVDALEDLKTRYFRAAQVLHKKISGCENMMNKLERQNEYEIFRSEADYLGRVYDVYASIEASPQSAAQMIQKANIEFKLDDQNLDFFTDQGYRSTKYGLLLRLADKLSTMNPKVIVQKSSDPKNLPYWGTSTNLSPRGQDSKLMKREDFISLGMKKLNGVGDSYLDWTKGYSVTAKKVKIEAMVALYKLGFYLGETDRITADEIISEMFDMIDTINIGPEDNAILAWLGLSNKLGTNRDRPIDDLEDISRKNDIKAALLDSVFVQVSTDKLSPSDVIEQSGPLDINQFNNILDDGISLYSTLTSFEEFLLPPDQDETIKGIFMQLYKPRIQKTLDITKDFEAAVTLHESGDASKVSKFVFDLNQGGTYLVDTSGGASILVSRNKLKAYDDSISDFTEPKTHHCFDAAECKTTGIQK